MKKSDLVFLIVSVAILLPFMPVPFLGQFQKEFLYNKEYWIVTSFIKFALLATLGEVIGYRIKTKHYPVKPFGVIPRAIVWGFLGLFIKLAFDVFGTGIPIFLEKSCGLEGALNSMKFKDGLDAFNQGAGGVRLLTAFSISVALNLIFAPVMMTFHKITDSHITERGGTIRGLFRCIHFGEIFDKKINWLVQWDFVFKRTIPFFWIPMHTITFLLPDEYRIIFAALLGVALGIILSFASIKGSKK
ncbi:MAG: hypothetical protein V2A54_01725 [Bacteroidota bacterium]